MPAGIAHLDLHCHTSASFDSLASPGAVVRAAAARGLTHLAITDHDRIEGALEARQVAETEDLDLEVLVGQEIRTREGDLIGVFLERAVPPGLSASEAIAAVREQGGLVGIPHPFDGTRGSLLRDAAMARLATEVDWIEAWNARILLGDGNQRAAELAVSVGVPGVAVSDAHTILEVAVASTIVHGEPGTADGLRAALAGERQLMTGRGSIYARLIAPAVKAIQHLRGHGRVIPA